MIKLTKRHCKFIKSTICFRCQYLKRFSFISRAKLEETKLTQKLRQKQNGINAVALAIGQKVTTEDLLVKVCVPATSIYRTSFIFNFPFPKPRMIHSKSKVAE